MAANHGKFWTKYKSDKNASDSYKDVDVATALPKLKGATTWVAFHDAFTYKLRDATNARGFQMVYLIDATVRAVTHGNANLLEANYIDLNKELLFDACTGEKFICIANIFYFKCKYLEHTSRGSKYTLAHYLVGLR